MPPRLSDAAFSVIQLTPKDLATAPRLDTALEQVPGVSLFRRTSSLAANPTTQGVSTRAIAGSGASRALVTLDGVPQNDPFGGWVIWTSLPPENLAGVNVVRGAGAGPYGSGALTGVISLDEAQPAPGAWSGDVEGGDGGQARAAGIAALAAPGGEVVFSAAGEHSDGWVPVEDHPGAADTRLTLTDANASLRYLADLGPGALAARIAAFEEDRGAGLRGAQSRARGAQASLTYAQAPSAGHWGWRAQAWGDLSNLYNSSVSVAAGRVSTTLSNVQYDTPADGYGANIALRRLLDHGELELGGDLRGASGEDREHFKAVAGVLTMDRHAGGETLMGGVYAEASEHLGPWLLVGAARVDDWSSSDGHRIEHKISTGAVTLNLHPPGKDQALPSFRLAVRRDLPADGFIRLAAYSGFRAPTLNELYRPFRVGNDVTESNPALVPEKLYGIEGGVGQDGAVLKWSATGFYNRLEKAVANVTIAHGPFLSPLDGFIVAGGTLFQRENIPAIDAHGVEFDSSLRVSANLTTRTAFAWTEARVDGGSSAPQLTGLRPAETPRLTASLGATWRPLDRLGLTGDVRYESLRFDDDQNTRRLNPGTNVDARADWRLNGHASLFLAMDNLFDAKIATGHTASTATVPGATSYDEPRRFRVGLTLRGGPGA
ncbi:TonB-dependent receptor [Phenylobacterium montanum]|uniref:TonB-dependent receptor n=1 Tax=Phenylobacterium montanum TaxID=2823693 RepID=A0A975G4Z2_9CAUL|nr:TonB-dependent receptor [Caulobacter sp. S6]